MCVGVGAVVSVDSRRAPWKASAAVPALLRAEGSIPHIRVPQSTVGRLWHHRLCSYVWRLVRSRKEIFRILLKQQLKTFAIAEQ